MPHIRHDPARRATRATVPTAATLSEKVIPKGT